MRGCNNFTFLTSFLMIGFSLFSCADDSVVSLLLEQRKCQFHRTLVPVVCVCVCVLTYMFFLMVEELEFVLVFVTVLEDAGVLGKTLFPGTVIGLFTAANTGAGFGCAKTETAEL